MTTVLFFRGGDDGFSDVIERYFREMTSQQGQASLLGVRLRGKRNHTSRQDKRHKEQNFKSQESLPES
jgi:hypothetical protein